MKLEQAEGCRSLSGGLLCTLGGVKERADVPFQACGLKNCSRAANHFTASLTNNGILGGRMIFALNAINEP